MRKIVVIYLRAFVIVALVGGMSLLCTGGSFPKRQHGMQPGIIQLLGPNDGAGGQGPE